MTNQKRSKLVTEEILHDSILEQNTESLELYKETDNLLKETSDILEQVNIALGRKKVYKYISGSTRNCKINHDAILPTTTSYKI